MSSCRARDETFHNRDVALAGTLLLWADKRLLSSAVPSAGISNRTLALPLDHVPFNMWAQLLPPDGEPGGLETVRVHHKAMKTSATRFGWNLHLSALLET